MKDVLPVGDLQFVLNALLYSPFEPMLMSKLDWFTWKTVFLMAVTTTKGLVRSRFYQLTNVIHALLWLVFLLG